MNLLKEKINNNCRLSLQISSQKNVLNLSLEAFKKFKPNIIRTQSDDSVSSDSSDVSLDLSTVNQVSSIKSSLGTFITETLIQ